MDRLTEAIKFFEPELKDGKCSETCPQCNANETALEILKAEQEREKGCEYCLKTHPEYAGYSDIWHQNKLSIGYGVYREINYCPMCGRDLRGEK